MKKAAEGDDDKGNKAGRPAKGVQDAQEPWATGTSG